MSYTYKERMSTISKTLVDKSIQWIDSFLQFITYFGLVLIPLPGTCANLGLLLLSLSLLRLPTTVQTIKYLIKKPLFILFMSWWLFALFSSMWAAPTSISLLANPLYILIVIAIWPLVKRPRLIILPLGFGVAIHTAIQLITWLGLVEGIRFKPFTLSGGLSWYPPFTALWGAVLFLLLLGIVLSSKTWKARTLPLLLLLPIPLSLLLAGNRSVFIVLPIMILLLIPRLVKFTLIKKQRVYITAICTIMFLLTVGLLLWPGSLPNERMKLLINQATKTFEPQLKQNESFKGVDKYHNNVGLRMLWWNAGIRIWINKPWIGHGDGSTRDQLAIQETKMPVEQGASTDGFIIVDPHSSILATAIDQGLVGVVLLLTFVLIAIVTEFTRNYISRLLVGLGPAWILVTIFALFHTLQFSNYTASLISILVSLSLRRSAKSCALQNELD